MPGPSRQLLPVLACLAAALAAGSARAAADDFGPVGDFALTERSGRAVTRADLLGKVWVASFVFTRCTGGCPQVSLAMKELQADLAAVPNVLLVTFTVDPGHDDPDELTRYAAAFGADPDRWLFLTGDEGRLHRLIRESFHLHAAPTTGADRRPGNEYEHSTRLVVVDAGGHIRGYFEGLRDPQSADPEGDFRANLKRLRRLVNHLAYRQDLPAFNALLNAASAALLVAGYAAVRRRRLRLHATCMLSALAVSALFLTSYLYYHLVIKGGRPTSFEDEALGAPDWVRHLYLAVLATHTVLAVFVALLAPLTAYLGLRGRLRGHVRLARWTLPVWLYVSVTGVAVYWMLYRLYPGP
jgi:uncharacterized membrane protein YozB (DUF420 family)/cytochrome oxidase Cu insertion factor (SCO1/SenC/PrrC family)